ncbi:hypothetical protein C8R47DRAFT_1221171 [Mycena vitilis]|nr:hypothetical protein C8R47DRAFT_1221171 [Mycena vitilis]
MPHTGPSCNPNFFDHGRSHKTQDDDSDKWWYVVIKGRFPGVYFEHDEARDQILRFHDMKWEKFPTKAEALQNWSLWCQRLHNHDPVAYKVIGMEGEFDTYDEALAAAATHYIVQA